MAKHRLLRNRLNPEEPGDGEEEEGWALLVKRIGREGGRGEIRGHHTTTLPLPPRPAEPVAGKERAIQTERQERRQSKSPRGQKRKRKGT